METKKWYESKIFWTSIIVTILALIPIANQFLQIVASDKIIVINAVGVLIAGVATAIMRIWFTSTIIE